MKLFSRWQEHVFTIAGQDVRLSLKAISPLESVAFMATMARVRKHYFAEATEADAAELDKILYPDFARETFERFVKPAEALEDDEGPITTGGDVFARIASPGLIIRVLFELEKKAVVTGDLGKDSSSPSTSPVVAGTDASASAATSTGPEAGTTPSTAPEIPAETE